MNGKFEGLMDQVQKRQHLEIVACAPQFFTKGQVVHFYYIPDVGDGIKRGEAIITHITDDGRILFEEGLPETVIAGDYMLVQS
jgi:hypothetical protein